jgi:hypothetical protein
MAIAVMALVGILSILDVITLQEATRTLGKTLSVVLIAVVAAALATTVVKLGGKA